MITVEFYKLVSVSLSKTVVQKVVIATGKTTIEEAFQVALENGHQWDKRIRFINA